MKKNNKLQKLNDAEMNHVKGGGYWDPEMGWVLDTVTVYASYMEGVTMYLRNNYGGVRADGWKDGSNSAQIGYWLGQLLFGNQ